MTSHNSPQSNQSIPASLGRICIVLLLTLIAGVLTGAWYPVALFLGAALGMFLAEHFGSTRTREFLFLLGTPLLSAWLLLLITIAQQRGGLSVSEFSLWSLLGLCTAIVPAALAVVALSILSAIFFKITGFRLLKFDWNR